MDQTLSPTRQELEVAIDDYAAAIHSNRANLIGAAADRLRTYMTALYEPRIEPARTEPVEPMSKKAPRQ